MRRPLRRVTAKQSAETVPRLAHATLRTPFHVVRAFTSFHSEMLYNVTPIEDNMDKHSLLRKLDEGVSSFRGLLAENDGSTLKAIAASAKQGFDSLKAAFDQNEKAQKAMAEIKKQMQDLEKSIRAGDKKLSATILATVEKKIRQYKEKYAEDKPAATAPEKSITAAAGTTGTSAAKKPAAAKSTGKAAKPAANKAAKPAPAKPGGRAAKTKPTASGAGKAPAKTRATTSRAGKGQKQD